MTSPNPIDDLESLDPFFDNHAVKNLPIKGSQRRKMGNAGNRDSYRVRVKTCKIGLKPTSYRLFFE